MKNTANRISAFTSVLMNCTIALLFSIFLVSYLYGSPKISADLQVDWVSPNRSFKMCRFIPNIDLTPQFYFNTKQVFLYLVTKSSNKQEMVWSKIIKNGENYKLTERLQSNYIFSETENGGKYEFELRGNIFPFVGQLKDVYYGTFIFDINKSK